MFTRLHIKDYQSIKKADLELAPFTVIVGKSRSGKSAALRALRAAIFNETGDDQIRWGQKQASVEIETTEGDWIIWKKTRTSAEYDFNGNRYTKLAGAVPPAIAYVLGVRTIIIGEGLSLAPQLHRQGEYAFLIDKSAGQAAKALAKMTRLDVVVKAQQHCKSAIRDIKDRLKAAKFNMEKLEPELDEWDTDENDRQLKWVDRAIERTAILSDALNEQERGYLALTAMNAATALGKSRKNIDLQHLEYEADLLQQGFDAMIEEDLSINDLAEADSALADRESRLESAEAVLATVDICPVCGKKL